MKIVYVGIALMGGALVYGARDVQKATVRHATALLARPAQATANPCSNMRRIRMVARHLVPSGTPQQNLVMACPVGRVAKFCVPLSL